MLKREGLFKKIKVVNKRRIINGFVVSLTVKSALIAYL